MADGRSELPAVVAVAASAGGLKALSVLLAALPPDFPAPVLVVQHIGNRPSLLPEILGRETALRVKKAQEGDSLLPGTAYVAPPDHHILVNANGTLSLSRSPKVNHTRPAADPLFDSVATAFGERVVGVVLTGGDSDGSDGARAIKRAGGTVIAQDRDSSQDFSMPRSAIETGCVDQVLPLEAIAPALLDLVRRATGGPAS